MARRMPVFPKGLRLQHTHYLFGVKSIVEIEVISGYDVIITKLVNAPLYVKWTASGKRNYGDGPGSVLHMIKEEMFVDEETNLYNWEGRSIPTTFNYAYNLVTGYNKDDIWKPI